MNPRTTNFDHRPPDQGDTWTHEKEDAHKTLLFSCLDVTPLGTGVALEALVTAEDVLAADNALGVPLAVWSIAPLILGVGGRLVIRHGLSLALGVYFRIISLKPLWRLSLMSRRSWHSWWSYVLTFLFMQIQRPMSVSEASSTYNFFQLSLQG